VFTPDDPDYHRDAPAPGHPAAQLERAPDGTWRPVSTPVSLGEQLRAMYDGAFVDYAVGTQPAGAFAGSLRSPQGELTDHDTRALRLEIYLLSCSRERLLELATYDTYLVRYSAPWL
jgi:hypothetical protein